jgi:hypothetical protein
MKAKNTNKKVSAVNSVFLKQYLTMQPKTSVVRLRVTQEQHDALMKAAHDSNLTFSDYARKALLKGIKTIESTYFAG